MTTPFQSAFPAFHKSIVESDSADLEHVLAPATDAQLEAIEAELRLPLPTSYKRLLKCARGFWLFGGAVQFGLQHPFYHDFDPLESLTPRQRESVARKGGVWPPPSNGMLCIAEFFLEADGDQVLFDVSKGLRDGEYPVVYYAHEDIPASVRKIADSFEDFLARAAGMFSE